RAQSQELKERLLSVTGTSELSEKPDLATISIRASAKDMNYNTAIDELNEKVESLRNAIKKAGFKKEDLKTSNFNVQKSYSYVGRERKFEGYEASHDLKLRLAPEKEELNKALSAMTSSLSEADFNISFSLEKPENLKEKLIKMAVDNAKERAQLLAQAAGVSLGKITDIQYSIQSTRPVPIQYRVTSDLRQEGMMAKTFNEVEPDEIKVRDQVTIIWEIH
ncbi:SIMPL domain-containing protein, partial [Xanthovirga aplysinae]|uniref:SIMPL domain-containing protein n=1 Tax=Xanthovirga aplysinae TaxID=2529853 RepID=UPI0012BBD7C2